MPGPFTLSQLAQNEHYPDQRTLALAYAEAINEELADLVAAGIDVVQLDEPYLQANADAARQFAVEAVNRALDGIGATTVLHTCYGYAVYVADKSGGYPFLAELADCAADQIAVEFAQPQLDPAVLAPLADKTIVLGVLDLSTNEVDHRVDRRPVACRPRRGAARSARRRARLRDEVPAPSRRRRETAGAGRGRGDGARRTRRLSVRRSAEPPTDPRPLESAIAAHKQLRGFMADEVTERPSPHSPLLARLQARHVVMTTTRARCGHLVEVESSTAGPRLVAALVHRCRVGDRRRRDRRLLLVAAHLGPEQLV